MPLLREPQFATPSSSFETLYNCTTWRPPNSSIRENMSDHGPNPKRPRLDGRTMLACIGCKQKKLKVSCYSLRQRSVLVTGLMVLLSWNEPPGWNSSRSHRLNSVTDKAQNVRIVPSLDEVRNCAGIGCKPPPFGALRSSVDKAAKTAS